MVEGVKDYVKLVISSFVKEIYPDVNILEQNIQIDHIHYLVEIPPKYPVSKIVGGMKSFSSMKLRKKFEYLKSATEVWSIGYFVSTVGSNEKIVKDYIEKQEKQDKGQAELALG